MKSNKILITGSNGFIGKNLIGFLQPTYNIVGLDIHDINSNLSIQYIQCDITNYEKLSLKLQKHNFDYIIHCAAIAHNDDGAFKEEDFYRVNTVGTKNLIDCLDHSKIKRFILFSTIAVYKEFNPKKEITEESATSPTSAYGKSKLDAEKYLIQNSFMPYTILRFSPVYSPEFLKDIKKRIMLLNFFGIYLIFKIGNGKQKYSFANIKNVQNIIRFIIDFNKTSVNGVFNFRDLNYYSQLDIINYFQNTVLKNELKLKIWIPKLFLRYFLLSIGYILKSKQQALNSIFYKLAEDNLFSNTKIKNTSFNLYSESFLDL